MQRLAVLLWSMEHAEVHFLSAMPSVHHAPTHTRTHSRPRTHTEQGTHDHTCNPYSVMTLWKQPELDDCTTHLCLVDPVDIYK